MSLTDLMQALGFDRADLNANRKGHFSPAQESQMRGFVRGLLRPMLRVMGAATFIVVVVLVGMRVIFGDRESVRFVAAIISLFWVLGIGDGGYIVFSLTRIRGRVRVGEITGQLRTQMDAHGKLSLMVGDATFHVVTRDPERVQNALEGDGIYTAYFMGPPHAATLLSIERKRA